ncbi:hypothetical protein sos41_38040 [Alphaproteobacteria bacterium SO-S41]|nr:hypothetical protein sos41_38040 [Alphaproteobacteria bacterium SO-S41]
MTTSAPRTSLLAALATALVGGLFMFGGSASAATAVLGSGSEQACFQAAETDSPAHTALASCDAALENIALPPADRAATYANRSVILLSREQPAAALADAEMALKLAPTMKAAVVNKAGALMMLGRYAEARAALDDALPGIEGAALERGLYNRAVASEELGDLKAAYRDYKRAADLNPNFEAAHVELARFKVGK